ncbi:MAG: mechanosensitive ion channel domain-containing protein [Cyanobacteria bacterium J06635_15]
MLLFQTRCVLSAQAINDIAIENFSQLEELVRQVQTLSLAFVLKLVAALLVFLVGRWVAGFVQRLVKQLMRQARIDATLIAFAGSLIYYGIVGFAVLIALGQLGIETTSLVATVAAAGLAVGLALQGSLSNLASGALVIIFRPFKVGDWIESCDVSGYVEDIQLLTTVIRTLDNRTVIVPNGNLMGGNITNYSTLGVLRVDLVVGVAYEEDIDRVKTVIQDELQKDNRILQDPLPTVGVINLGSSSVDFAVRPWVKTEHYWPVYFNTYENVKKRLDAEGITIPFPQRDVHVYRMGELAVGDQNTFHDG